MTVPRALLLVLAAGALLSGDLVLAGALLIVFGCLRWARPDPPEWWIRWGGWW